MRGAFYRVNKAPVSISIHLYQYNTFCMITYRLYYLLLIVVDLAFYVRTHHTVKHFDGAVTLDAEFFLQHCYQVFNLSDATESKLVVVVAVDVVLVQALLVFLEDVSHVLIVVLVWWRIYRVVYRFIVLCLKDGVLLRCESFGGLVQGVLVLTVAYMSLYFRYLHCMCDTSLVVSPYDFDYSS
nr:MAG TPA: hypothetical protein [Caudoviricetes sp.]